MAYFADFFKALFAKLGQKNSNNYGTASNTGVPLLDMSDMSAKGGMNITTLGQVLGAVVRSVDYDKNIDYLNGIKDNSIRLISIKSGESEGMPFGQTFLLLTFTTMIDANTPRCTQQAFGAFGVSIGQQKFRVFTSTGWSEWY